MAVEATTTATAAVATGLGVNTSHDIRVVAVNGAGLTSASSTVTARPFLRAVAATSRPMKPPPMTTTRPTVTVSASPDDRPRRSSQVNSGATIAVRISIDKAAREATIDFTGTTAQRANNFNAPGSVTKAAVLYVFRCLVDSEIPMNAGCLKPLEVVIPEGCMLRPRYPAAVVAGNVETSQAVTDTLFGALGALALGLRMIRATVESAQEIADVLQQADLRLCLTRRRGPRPHGLARREVDV